LRKLTQSSDRILRRVQRQAQERAQELARRVPWQVLLETRNQYLAWQEFYYWARSILDCEEHLPGWLKQRLEEMCPGFIASETDRSQRHAGDARLAVSLGKWIDEHIFAFAAQAGWLPAVTFYAVRDPRYGKVSRYWSESTKNWREVRPREYPVLADWVRDAQLCDETIDLLPEFGKQRECLKLVRPERLAEAVSRYIDLEAFAYWARPVLEQGLASAPEVVRAVEECCAGFTAFNLSPSRGRGQFASGWDHLMRWIADNLFQEATDQGWFDAILISAHMHPRSIRTMEYADHCEEVWKGQLPVPYPPFRAWREDADRYVEAHSF